jgi:hypothetical protein
LYEKFAAQLMSEQSSNDTTSIGGRVDKKEPFDLAKPT